jgi:hypothetical protein
MIDQSDTRPADPISWGVVVGGFSNRYAIVGIAESITYDLIARGIALKPCSTRLILTAADHETRHFTAQRGHGNGPRCDDLRLDRLSVTHADVEVWERFQSLLFLRMSTTSCSRFSTQ